VPLLRDGNLVGALAYNCRFGTALAYHYNEAGRVLMTSGDDEGYAWARHWNTNSPSDVTVESFDCVDACVFGCMAVCAIACVPTEFGYIACLAACQAGCTALCVNMCESEGGPPGGPGGGPPAAESIGAVP
jgi:hypothetical protein